MAKKSLHTDVSLFDYLSGALDERGAREVEEHLRGCKDCASVADLFSAMRSETSGLKSPRTNEHPDVSELARFFYDRPRAAGRQTAAHVAACRSCAAELAEFARAEREASSPPPADVAPAEIPAAEIPAAEIPAGAWDMIREWEEGGGARLKPLSGAARQEVFAELAELLSRRKDELREMAREQVARDFDRPFPDKLELVPVIIVDRAGQFRGVEMFEKVSGPRGANVLTQVEKSNRFDKKPFQAFLDFGEKSYVVISDLVRRDTVRLQHVTHPDRSLCDTDYFIIDE
jgi:hypothetical protein